MNSPATGPATSPATSPATGAATRIETSRTIPFAAAAIFAVLRDPQGHVAIDSSGMLQTATGVPATRVGDSFVAHMDREALGDLPMGRYDAIVTFTAFEPDRLLTWEVSGEGFPSIGHFYGYRLEPVDLPDGVATLTTSIYDWSAVGERWTRGGHFPIINERALRATLGILERVVRSRHDFPVS